MNDLNTWICDTCGKLIKSPNDGWVEWLARNDGEGYRAKSLRLVHHRSASPLKDSMTTGCQYDKHYKLEVNDLELAEFLGSDGLMMLLSMLTKGKVHQEELLEMIKRLHVPGFEHTRLHFDLAFDQSLQA
jgi:hypothetical protein